VRKIESSVGHKKGTIKGEKNLDHWGGGEKNHEGTAEGKLSQKETSPQKGERVLGEYARNEQKKRKKRGGGKEDIRGKVPETFLSRRLGKKNRLVRVQASPGQVMVQRGNTGGGKKGGFRPTHILGKT